MTSITGESRRGEHTHADGALADHQRGDDPAVDDLGEDGTGRDPSTLIDHVAEQVRRAGGVIGSFDPEPDEIRYDRSATSVARLVICALGILAVAALGELLPYAHEGLQRDLSARAGRWTVGLGRLGDAVASAVSVLTLVLSMAAAIMARRRRQVLTSIVAAVVAAGTIVLAARLAGATPGRVIGEEWALVAAAAAISVSVASFSVFSAPIARWSAAGIGVFTVLGVLGSDVSLASRVMALLAGGAAGAATALVFGTASRRISRRDLAEALELVRLPVTGLEPHRGDARGSQPWSATLATGRDVFVKVTAVDELRADQLFRLWRRLRLRRADDERSPASVRRAVEHEAFVAGRAAAVGVSTPSVLGLGTLADERGMFVVFENVDGETLDRAGDLSDQLLRSAWSQIQVLRRAGIAHRDLRAANLMKVGDAAWVIDFGFAEVAAGQDLLDRDLAELLVSTSALVGIERAVENAVAVLGADTLAGAIGWIQPLAVSNASRAALPKADFETLRECVRSAAGISAPELPQLHRVSRKAVISTIGLGLAVWAVLPQLTSGIDWGTILDAHPAWIAAGLAASLATYVGATISVAGSVTDPVPRLRTFLAQLASSFTNRVTPAKVGGMALNVRFLTKQGIDAATATTGIALSTASGTVVHIVLTTVAALWAGNVGLPGLELPPWRTVLFGVVALVVGLGVVTAIPPVRRWCLETLLPPLRRAWRSFMAVMRSPRHVLMLLGGSTLVTVANVTAFVAGLRAFGVDLPVSSAALVYLAGAALASAAPTPGGLGATEAALVAGLAVVSVEQRLAIPAVLLFRLVTFWLPILPGWIALTALQRRDDL